MTAAIRLEVAREQVASLSAQQLNYYTDHDKLWDLARRVGVAWPKLERLISRERYRRGLLKLSDLPPHERRGLIDNDNLDLHALASGPIMDAANLYCPLGKLSMAETRAREAKQVLL